MVRDDTGGSGDDAADGSVSGDGGEGRSVAEVERSSDRDDLSDDADGQWRFALDEVGEEAGPPPLEPGSPSAEHVLFVLVGVVLTFVLIVGAV